MALALVALSLGLSNERTLARRLGRNAAFASAGTGIAAGLMGASGYFVSTRAVFYIAGALAIPAIVALFFIPAAEIAPASDAARGSRAGLAAQMGNLIELLRQPRLVIFALCVMMFHLANAAMLPLAASLVTLRSDKLATVLVAAAIVVPQFTVTLLSPFVARFAESWGRRPLLLFGFGALAIRGVLFAWLGDPRALVAIQLLDGVSAAALGVLVPLTVADLTRELRPFQSCPGRRRLCDGIRRLALDDGQRICRRQLRRRGRLRSARRRRRPRLRAAGGGDAGNRGRRQPGAAR